MEVAMQSRPLIGSLPDATPRIHPEAWIAPGAVIVGNVTVGRASSVWYGSVLRADDDEIVVGAECNIQDLCCLHVDAGEPAVLEDRVSLGHRAVVHGAHVGAGALIGIGAVVLGRARIGAGSLIAAGAVVTPGSSVPAGVLVAGVPGRVLRELTEADRELFAGTAAGYVARSGRHRSAQWHEQASELAVPAQAQATGAGRVRSAGTRGHGK
jgi:carbonic anhydrase/acetyltransferase-like protein (isoleucine patch superfamily)